MFAPILQPLVLVLITLTAGATGSALYVERRQDPCAAIGGQKWVSPKAVRDCFTSIKVNETWKTNILDVIGKTLAFHTSVNYQIRAPQPFAQDVHEDILSDLARISKTNYPSDYDLHLDLSRTVKRLDDAHCVWVNLCYVTLFTNYLPVPLVLLTDPSGKQDVHIAPEAFSVASAEFPDQIDFWQNALPGQLKGQLASLSGAKVILINGLPPNFAVDANAKITGGFQALGTRQNAFFASYRPGDPWTYVLGNFASQTLPLDDEVRLTIQRTGIKTIDTIQLPYRSRFMGGAPFTDTASLLANNCQAGPLTNAISISGLTPASVPPASEIPLSKFQQQAPVPLLEARKHAMDVILDTSPLSDVALPPELTPQSPVSGSSHDAQFHMLDDGITGVLALGSFSGSDFAGFLETLLRGLVNLKSAGATRLVIDVSNNGGGFICAAAWLRRIIVGPKPSTEPQALLNTAVRAGPLAQQIVKNVINSNIDPLNLMLYNPLQWRDVKQNAFPANADWLDPSVHKVVNGKDDFFSQEIGQECQPFGLDSEPSEGLFDPTKVAIVSNGRCASSCALFGIVMAKLEGSKTAVVGGRTGVNQQYCGTVGGQSSDFSTMDAEVKAAGLKNDPLAPPDLLVNGIFGITWRLAYGASDPSQFEEWQDHPADLNLLLTPKLVNNPIAIWEEVARELF